MNVVKISTKKIGSITCENTNFYVEIYGEGQPLILLHGNGEDSTYFEEQIHFFSKYYRVIVYDARGHGKSNRGNKKITVKQLAADLACIINKLELTNINLLGFSDGANVAIECIVSKKNVAKKINKLILVGGNLSPQGLKKGTYLSILFLYTWFLMLGIFSMQSKRKAEILSLMVAQPNIDAEQLKRLQMPTLIIAGEHDVIKETHTEYIARKIPQGRLYIMENANHYVFKKNATLFNKKVLDFLKHEC